MSEYVNPVFLHFNFSFTQYIKSSGHPTDSNSDTASFKSSTS
ncbi:MAG: hypothetical protein SPJ27_06860 [Candidatus Onthovivens sp.]|nr:hypothetical protein [Candidatus Onthovivens sp.]